MGVQSFRELIVWQKSMDMAANVYKLTKCFPRSEVYGLTSQLTRAASSVPANIAEGNYRGSLKEYSHFLSIARGSLAETETFLLLATRLEYVQQSDILPTLALMNEIGKMLTAMRGKLQ